MTGPIEQLLTVEQAAKRLAVPASWLRDGVKARRIQHTRLSPRNVRFSEADLAAIVAQSVSPAEQPRQHRRPIGLAG